MLLKILSAFIFFIFLFNVRTFAQQKELPSWVAMIDNPTTNYFEAQKVFNDYWKGKIKPIEEMDIKDMEMLTPEEKQIRKNYFQNLSQQERAEFDILQYHYKRFKQWKKEILQYVQEDGRILTMEERIAIWEKQQSEIRK